MIFSNEATMHAGDPGLMFHEYLVMIARIAYETFPRELEKKESSEILTRYFKYIFIRKNEDIKTVPLPSLSRKMISKMKDYYAFIESEAVDERSKEKKV